MLIVTPNSRRCLFSVADRQHVKSETYTTALSRLVVVVVRHQAAVITVLLLQAVLGSAGRVDELLTLSNKINRRKVILSSGSNPGESLGRIDIVSADELAGLKGVRSEDAFELTDGQTLRTVIDTCQVASVVGGQALEIFPVLLADSWKEVLLRASEDEFGLGAKLVVGGQTYGGIAAYKGTSQAKFDVARCCERRCLDN